MAFSPFSAPNYGFVILCLPAGMHVHVSRQSLPPFVNPSLLRLDDPRCGVKQMDDNGVMLATPLNSCGTVRRYRPSSSFNRLPFEPDVIVISSV